MMKQKLLKTMLLLCALIVGSGTMWATDFVINTTNFTAPNSGSGYTAYDGTRAISGINITSSNVMVQSGNLQFKKSINACLYNSTAMPGNITKITLASTENLTIHVGTSENSVTQSVTSGSTISGNYTFFKVTNASSKTATTATITVEYSTGPSYTINAVSNNTSYGTVSLTGSTITATPVDGCYYADPAYTVTSGTASVSQSGNEFTVTPSTDCTVRINFAATPVSGITLSPTSLSLSSESSTEQLTATVSPNDASFKNVTWSSSDESVATVTSEGVVNAVGSGSATITARATNGTDDTTDDFTATCTVNVSSVTYAVALADGTADAANWNISSTPATAGQTVTISYTGSRTITSVSAVKKPFGLSTFSFATPALGESSNLTFTGASTEKPVWFTGKCDTHNTTGAVTYSHVAAGSYDELYFDGQLISRTGYPYPFTLYITDGLGTKAAPFVLSFDEGSSDMELTTTPAGDNTWTITMPTSDVEIQVLMPYTVTLADDGSELKEASGGEGVTLPSRSDIGSYEFAGWSETNVATETTSTPTIITTDDRYYPTSDIPLYPVYTRTEGSVSDFVDVLNRALTGVTSGSTTYSGWSGKTATSDAVYAGNSAGDHNAIQLRSNNSNSGIVTTESGGTVKKVVITWNTNTSATRTVSIYGKDSKYDAATDLYDNSKKGTLLGELNIDNATDSKSELTVDDDDDFEYIGIRSKSGALYLDEVKITWSSGSSTTYYISKPSVSVTANEGEKDEYWATYYNNDYNVIAPSGTKVFKVALSGSAITMTEIADRIVTKGQGVVLKGTSNSISMTVNASASAGDYTGNSLQGTTTQITNPGNAYVLNKKEAGIGFYKLSESGTIGANKAYLTYDGELVRGYFLFDDATGISSLTTSPEGERSVYDLQGRRVALPTKGLYIVNGKKVIIK